MVLSVIKNQVDQNNHVVILDGVTGRDIHATRLRVSTDADVIITVVPYNKLVLSMGVAPVRPSTTHGDDRRHIRDYKMTTTSNQGSQTLVTIENIRVAHGAYR